MSICIVYHKISVVSLICVAVLQYLQFQSYKFVVPFEIRTWSAHSFLLLKRLFWLFRIFYYLIQFLVLVVIVIYLTLHCFSSIRYAIEISTELHWSCRLLWAVCILTILIPPFHKDRISFHICMSSSLLSSVSYNFPCTGSFKPLVNFIPSFFFMH